MLTFTILLIANSVFSQVVVSDSLCDGSIYVKTDEYEGIIFGANCPENVKDDKTYRWSPTEEDIALAEELMKKYIAKIVKKNPSTVIYGTSKIHLNFDKYYRQYFGIIDRHGRKILFVNCFWKEYENRFPGWKQSLIGVCDGGSYYWRIRVNLKKKKCFDYRVNGCG